MAKPDLAVGDPILSNFSIISCGKKTLTNNWEIQKIGMLTANLVYPFNFFWNFALETTFRMSISSWVWELKFQYWMKQEVKSTTLCCCSFHALEYYVTIMCRNDELSLTMSWVFFLLKDSELFILFAENSQILFKISVIPILLTFMYLVARNLLENNQLNSLSNSTHHCGT